MPAATTTTTVAPEPPQPQLWYRPTGDKVLEPFSNPLTAAEHKIRNLEKRKLKLDQYRNEQAEGKTLNADQLAAVAKYNEVIQQLEHNRELVSCLRQVHQQTIKFIKQELRRENADRNKFILSLQAGLDQLQNPNVQHDFLLGDHGAVKVTEEDLTDLSELTKLVRPSLREPDFAAKIETGAELVAKLFESRGKVNNKPSHQLKTMIDSIVESQYFTSGPTPIVPIETVEEVVPRPQETPNPVHVPEIPMGNNNPVPAQIMMNQDNVYDKNRYYDNEQVERDNTYAYTDRHNIPVPVKARPEWAPSVQIHSEKKLRQSAIPSAPPGISPYQRATLPIPSPSLIGRPNPSPVLGRPSTSPMYGRPAPSPVHGQQTRLPVLTQPTRSPGNGQPTRSSPRIGQTTMRSPVAPQPLSSPVNGQVHLNGDHRRYHPYNLKNAPQTMGELEVRSNNLGFGSWRDRDMAYSFMQESQLEIESPHMDPAVVAVSSYAPPPPQLQPQPENNHVFTPAPTEGLTSIQSGVRDLNLNHMNSNNVEEEEDWDDKITTATFNNSTSVNGNMEGGDENTNGFDRSGRGSFRGRGGRARGRGNGYGNSRPPRTGGSRGGFHQGPKYGAFRAERIGQSDAETAEFRGKGGGRGFPRSFRGNGNVPPSAGGPPPRRGGRGAAKTFNGIHEPRSSE